MKKAAFFILLNLITSAGFGAAQADREGLLPQLGRDFVSPVTTPAYKVLITGAVLTTTLVILADQVGHPLQSSVATTKPLGKLSPFGDYAGMMIPNAAYFFGMLAHGHFAQNSKSKWYAEHMFRSTLHASVVTTVLKYTVREPRPNDGNDRRSFPSGHATTAFAFASVVGAEHEWYWGASAYALASFVGFSRINDNKHYLHDVVAGATIGVSYGLGIYYREQARKQASESGNAAFVTIIPLDNLRGAGAVYSSSF